MEPILHFNVRNQKIERTDRFYVVAKSKNYLQAEFCFKTSDWEEAPLRTAVFTKDGISYNVILKEDRCIVPWEVLQSEGLVRVSVFGGNLITVSQASVTVNKSGYSEGAAPEEPTKEVYSQLVSMATETRALAQSVRQDADNGAFNGKKGDTGPRGPMGPHGLQGETGKTGPMGPQGIKGDQGEVGPQGPKGETGDKGQKGEKGDKGDKGDRGETGKSAYEYAQEAGFGGSEEDFAQELARVVSIIDGNEVMF